MQPKPELPPAAARLRRSAEERLKEQHLETRPPPTEADAQRLLHELQVHQIELEMQNEELQRARDQLEAGLEKYSDLYDFAPVGYLTLDREGTVQEANLAAASLLGVDRSRLLTQRLGRFVSAVDRPVFTDFLAKVFGGKTRRACEVTVLGEGKPPVEVQIEASVTASGRECRAVLEDLTEPRRAAEARLVANKLESAGILAGGLAHDFNNLLAVIVLNLDLLQTLRPSGPELEPLLDEATKAAFAARNLTQQLLAFAHGGAPVRQPIRLAPLIEEAVRLALSGSRVRCEIFAAEELGWVEADAGQIGQVLRNLALNAREAMPEGGTLTVRAGNVAVGLEGTAGLPPGEYVRVSLADQGGGIPKERLSKIFDPYFSTKRRGAQKGMGLGLTICHAIVQKHGGAIAVESAVGRGSTFRIYLPAGRKLPGEQTLPVPPSVPRASLGRILVMDDEEGVRKVLGLSLRRLGHEVELVADGQRAVEAYERSHGSGRPFDAVLMDLTVRGGLGGLEALQALRKIDPAVKAIVMSGYANDPVVQEPQHHGFEGVLEKPFAQTALQEVLSRVLGSRTGGRLTP